MQVASLVFVLEVLTCTAAIVNGTLYMYGFRTSTSAQQNDNTWSRRRYSSAR